MLQDIMTFYPIIKRCGAISAPLPLPYSEAEKFVIWIEAQHITSVFFSETNYQMQAPLLFGHEATLTWTFFYPICKLKGYGHVERGGMPSFKNFQDKRLPWDCFDFIKPCD
jgi:hypothetical protein